MRVYLHILLVFLVAGCCANAQTPDAKAQVDVHLQKAREAVSHHDLRGACREYRAILEVDPGNVSSRAALGITLYALGEPAQAIAPLKTVLSIDPNHADAEAFLGLSLAEWGHCPEALAPLQKRFAGPLDSKVHRLVGLSLLGCLQGAPDKDQAIDVARKLKQSFPQDPDVLYQIAELYSSLSKESVNELLKTNPDSYRVHELAGEALEAQDNDHQALIEYQKAIDLNPKAPHLHYRMGALLLRGKESGSDTRALDQFRQELALNRGDAPSEYQIAEILRTQNQPDEAAAHFRKALELNPGFVEAHVGLAQTYLATHRADEAVAQLRDAVQLSPEDPGPHYSLMLAYRALGKLEEANREMATVSNLRAKKRADFDANLHTLLTGQRN